MRETLDGPPTWYRARAMATYAIALMATRRYDDAWDWVGRAREAARAAGSASVEADALVTNGQLALRAGDSDEAIGLFTAAIEQAGAAGAVGVRLRAGYQLAAERLARGELGGGRQVAHRGVDWAEAEGLGLAPFGLDLQHLHFQAHFADGSWDHAQELADGFPVRVTRRAEAHLVRDGAVRRHGPGQPGGGRAADLAGAVLGRRLRRLHRARAPGRACPVAGGLRARPGRGGSRDRRGRVARPQPLGDPGDGDRPGGPGRPGGAAAGDRGRRRRGGGGGGRRRAAPCRRGGRHASRPGPRRC